MFLQELFNDGGKRLRRAPFGPRRVFGRETSKFANKVLGEFAEMGRFLGHDFERSAGKTRLAGMAIVVSGTRCFFGAAKGS